MKQEFILSRDKQSITEVLASLCNYIVEHQSDYIKDERVYEYMRTAVCAYNYLPNGPYDERVCLMLKKIDNYECSNFEKYKIMMQMLNLIVFYPQSRSFDDEFICKLAEKIKDVKAIDAEKILGELLGKNQNKLLKMNNENIKIIQD